MGERVTIDTGWSLKVACCSCVFNIRRQIIEQAKSSFLRSTKMFLLFFHILCCFSLFLEVDMRPTPLDTQCYESNCFCSVDKKTMTCGESADIYPRIGKSRKQLLVNINISAKQHKLFEDICAFVKVKNVVYNGPCPQTPLNCSEEIQLTW